MTTPTVTEITRASEPLGRDTFVDGPADPAKLASPWVRYAASTLQGAPPRHVKGRTFRPAPQRAAADGGPWIMQTRAA